MGLYSKKITAASVKSCNDRHGRKTIAKRGGGETEMYDSWISCRMKWMKHEKVVKLIFFYSCSPKVMSQLQRPVSLKTDHFG